MTSFSITSIKNAILEFQEDSAQFITQQKSDFLFPSGRTRDTSGRPFVFEKILNSSAFQHVSIRTTGQHRPNAIQCSRIIQIPLQTQIEKTAYNRLVARATLSERGFNKEKREARYGSRLQFSVPTPFDYVRTRPREIRISVELGYQKLINREL